ncbi:hypothetical protein SKAU_G00393350 [Synaphobranchus kaupii]|uniref:Uncharacterized protein n=1 Tax=Synaphobranchus kaupii TaxID=118154 RepID=A0A9Q1EC13_SYNKA|nr:hypothetical protein SKAU_G00393350 [Synaphobranchus kaupii]
MAKLGSGDPQCWVFQSRSVASFIFQVRMDVASPDRRVVCVRAQGQCSLGVFSSGQRSEFKGVVGQGGTCNGIGLRNHERLTGHLASPGEFTRPL